MASFTDTAAIYGLPAATLTDNGSVYTSRFTHGHNDFERLLNSLGVTQKNGHPGHPQTQGKIERFHRTLKLWLGQHRRPSTLDELQQLLDTFATIYNTERPHRAHRPSATPHTVYHARRPSTLDELQQLLDTFATIYNTERPHRAHRPSATPHTVYHALPKAHPATVTEHFRIRHDTVDQFGKLTLRYGSRLHHLGIGREHAHTPVLILVATQIVTVISKTGHHLIGSHHIDPDRNYWRNQQKDPGRWPGQSVTDDATQV
ncbi:integrase core domain-containing protein [Mycolicibacterium poriferae]|uniref:integrase core domain-containing protein n=1 Tax=Mycolicibacterium poriferae TaxID=39694 RepID=UPI0021F33A10|nr:integrase core domain-containing protein [Mycolicibacterium poriferae]